MLAFLQAKLIFFSLKKNLLPVEETDFVFELRGKESMSYPKPY